jgi:predicted DCC family thiol-disulfide oxidoreductase YuxK
MTADVPIIVLIDGDCALCHATTVWFARRNQAECLIFATNQGVTAKIAQEPPGGNPDTVVVWSGSKRLTKSDAILAMLRALGGVWAFYGALGRYCPKPWRDFVYSTVARNRKKFGSPGNACTLLSPFDLAE